MAICRLWITLNLGLFSSQGRRPVEYPWTYLLFSPGQSLLETLEPSVPGLSSRTRTPDSSGSWRALPSLACSFKSIQTNIAPRELLVSIAHHRLGSPFSQICHESDAFFSDWNQTRQPFSDGPEDSFTWTHVTRSRSLHFSQSAFFCSLYSLRFAMGC